MDRTRQLQVAATGADKKLAPEHKRFNQLLQKIGAARDRLAAWQEQMQLYAEAHSQRIRPLEQELLTARHDWAFELESLLQQPHWTRQERDTVVRMICEVAESLLDSRALDLVQEAALKALFDRHADVSWDDQGAEQLQEMKGLVGAMSGLDLSDADVETEEDLMRHVQQRLQEESERTQQARAETSATQRQRRHSAAERRREEDARQATQSVREVYRKLASALHPDRAEDDTQRELMTARMQRVNQAYESGDLLALLELQLEIEQIDAGHIAETPAVRLRHFNKVLAEQLEELQDEIEEQEMMFCLRFGIVAERRLDPRKLGPLLEEDLRDARAAMLTVQRERRVLANPGDLAGIRRWLKKRRRQYQIDHRFATMGDDLF